MITITAKALFVCLFVGIKKHLLFFSLSHLSFIRRVQHSFSSLRRRTLERDSHIIHTNIHTQQSRGEINGRSEFILTSLMASSEVSSKGNAAQAESLSSAYSDRNDADGGSRTVPAASGGSKGNSG